MNNLKIGWAEVSITPDKKVSLVGQFAERISEYVEKPITVTAMALSTADDQAVLLSCDLVGVSKGLVLEVRSKLSGNDLGLDPSKLILAATHIHTGPGYAKRCTATELENGADSGFLNLRNLLVNELPDGLRYVEFANVSANPDVADEDELLTFISDRIVECVLKAWKCRAPGNFINAFGRVPVGMCRRVSYSDGSAQMWGDTNTAVFDRLEGGNDSGVELMYVFNESRKLTGVVANIACPAQCVQHRLFVSPDYWGEAKMLLRQHFGEDIFLLALCSAAGDQCPVDLIRWTEPESDVHDPNLKRTDPPKRTADPSMFDLSGMRKAGKRVAREIIDIYNDGLGDMQEAPELIHQVHMMQLPLRRATLNEINNAHAAIREYLRGRDGNVDFNDLAALQVHLGILQRATLQERTDIIEAEVHILKLGTVAIATNPFELFLDYGNQIRARSHAEQTFLIQLANGSEGYVPTENAENGGHYSAFISSGVCGHAGGDQLVRETLKNINELFQ